MTNEYKLASSVPTDGMCIEGNETIASLLEVGELAGVDDVYKAMLKDAPTLIEVDIDAVCLAILHDWNKGVTLKNALLSNLQKHDKLYAVKGE